MEKKKLVYIAHPIGGDVKQNLEKIKTIYYLLTLGNDEIIPFAPYWITCHALDDSNPDHREIGMVQNKYFFENKIIDEVWVYGGLSNGVKQEIEWASQFGINVVFKF